MFNYNQETIYSLLCAVLPCFIYLLVWGRKKPLLHSVWVMIFVLYCWQVYDITGAGGLSDILYRPEGSINPSFIQGTVNLIPFQNFTTGFFLNILMCVPLGLLLPFVWKAYRKFRVTVLSGAGFSALIEVSQLSLIDAAYAECLNQQGTPVRVHIGIDSGMHRLGFDADDFENIRQVFRMKNLKVDGMFTHLCCCESLEPEDVAFTKNQICRFYALIDYLKEHKVPIPKLHIQSSYGLLNYPELKCDYVREGISLYGVASTPQDKTTLQLDLRPVLALKAKVILIRDVPQGDFVGYDRAYQTERDSKIAILPIGYGDGFPRNLSCGKASVKIGTYIVPIIGRICMDQLAIDITDTEGVAVGDTATLIDNQENSLLSTPCVAERSDSISNEILSRMGARLPIVIKE